MEPTDAKILCDVEKMPCSGATCLMLGAQVCQCALQEGNGCDPGAVGKAVLYPPLRVRRENAWAGRRLPRKR